MSFSKIVSEFTKNKPHFSDLLKSNRGKAILKFIEGSSSKHSYNDLLKLLLEQEVNKDNTVRKRPSRPGLDETQSADTLASLVKFVGDQDTQRQTQPKRKISLSEFRSRLKWLYDMIDERQKSGRFRTTGNTLQKGRFYTFNYVPRHEKQLNIWDARPIVLCLNPSYATHFFNNKSKKPNIGMLGINWHYIPMRQRRLYMKNLIYNHQGNKARFLANQAIDVTAIEGLNGIYNGVQRYGALRQYLRPGKYADKSGDQVTAGCFNIIQIPYNNITEILEIPSIYDAAFVGGVPSGL
jgi:hypothetical protein